MLLQQQCMHMNRNIYKKLQALKLVILVSIAGSNKVYMLYISVSIYGLVPELIL